MPIYAYKCASCGFAKDVLQKLSDPPLTVCTQCSEPQFSKQVTAAGFQLKGSGWYVTDFRGGDKPKADTVSATGESGSVKSTTSETSSTSTSGDSSATSTATQTSSSSSSSAQASPSKSGTTGSSSSTPSVSSGASTTASASSSSASKSST